MSCAVAEGNMQSCSLSHTGQTHNNVHVQTALASEKDYNQHTYPLLQHGKDKYVNNK